MSILVETASIKLETKGNGQVVDLTEKVANIITRSQSNSGMVNIFIPGATASITTIEYEDGLIRDLKKVLEKIVPQDVEYAHNLKWHDGNGHSHLRATLLGPSLTVPFKDKKLLLGTWQQIVLVDFDNRSRNRKVICQILGN